MDYFIKGELHHLPEGMDVYERDCTIYNCPESEWNLVKDYKITKKYYTLSSPNREKPASHNAGLVIGKCEHQTCAT